jgi:hypothetical protein
MFLFVFHSVAVILVNVSKVPKVGKELIDASAEKGSWICLIERGGWRRRSVAGYRWRLYERLLEWRLRLLEVFVLEWMEIGRMSLRRMAG